MLSLLFPTAAGYALGLFVTGKWLPYLLSVLASPLVYVLVITAFTVFSLQGAPTPTVPELAVATLVQAPLAILGTYFARRKDKRNGYKI